MFDRIKKALDACGISDWRILETVSESYELFFIKKSLDTRRIKDTKKYTVTVFRKENGKCGETSVTVIDSYDDEKIASELKGAYYAAQFAMNPDYELPEPVRADRISKKGFLAENDSSKTAEIMTKAVLEADGREGAFLNSIEMFIIHKSFRIVSSNGTDVSWSDAAVKGEHVVQCKEPEDVEMFFEYEYDECDPDSLKAEISKALDFVSDRARAEKILKTGEYDVVLSDDSLREILSYYAERSDAAMIYAKYSDWKEGTDVQQAQGEKLDLTLRATSPYSAEGVPMKDFALLKDGVVKGIHGDTRFSRYLGVKPTGSYRKIECENEGSESFEQLKKAPCLWAVSFSAFEMDSFSGHFGGEIRLAYLIDGEKVTPVTGGSINGNLLELQKNIKLSKERYSSAFYHGPSAIRFSGVPVAGIN